MTRNIDVPIVAAPANIPHYAHDSDAGCDLTASISEPVRVPVYGTAKIPTGVRVAVPDGYYMAVVPRSGLATKHGITIINSPGTVDSGYTGEVMVTLVNHGRDPYIVSPGDRIGQAVFHEFIRARFIPVEKLPDTPRGDGGHGSTGITNPNEMAFTEANWPAILGFLGWTWDEVDIEGMPLTLTLTAEDGYPVPELVALGDIIGKLPNGSFYTKKGMF